VSAVRSPSISDLMESPNDKRECATAALAGRLRQVAEQMRATDPLGALFMDTAAARLARCAHAGKMRTGWRCGAAYCPRCARRIAISYRKRLERRMRARAHCGAAPHGFGLLTLTVAAADPIRGHRVLGQGRARFFREAPARAVIAGGESHIHAERASGAEGDSWNVHLHAIVELKRRFRDVDTGALQSTWAQVLAPFGAHGSLDLRQRHNLTAGSLRDEAP
jgi:hypothetical protein